MKWVDTPLFAIDGRRLDVLVGLDPEQMVVNPTDLVLTYPAGADAEFVTAGNGFGAGFRIKLHPGQPNGPVAVRVRQRGASGTCGVRIVDVATGAVLAEATGPAGRWVGAEA